MDVEARLAIGRIRGRAVDGYAVFRNIPFARPPVGDLRFAAPQPPLARDGVRDGTLSGPGCPQPVLPGADPMARLHNPAVTGEDCLTLEVWTPDPGPFPVGLPVMVWIHGGGYAFGAGSAPGYEGSAFARDGVVYVAINYRLNVEGFLPVADRPANLGLRDQVAALTWVRENIAAFGGNPDNVTVFGQSAGAVSVMNLLAMPSARGLFRRVIAQSGACTTEVSRTQAHEATDRLAQLLHVPATVEGFNSADPAATQDAVLRLALEYNETERWGAQSFLVSPFRTVIDEETLPQDVLTALAEGASADVEVLAGTTRDETISFLAQRGQLDRLHDGFAEQALKAFGLTRDDLAVYDQASRPGASSHELVQAAWTDWAFRIPTLRLLEAHQGPHWAYEFTWQSPALPPGSGAAHTLEVPFVHDNLAAVPAETGLLGEEPPHHLATVMHRAWIDFAHGRGPGWHGYDTTRRVTMRFDADSGPVDDLAGAERQLWHGIR
ncbi:carboxylesterase family protein [Streptomyces sp. NPDC046925]|uniref:carboxylesterase/lipase family protein n=1 Tax=Streptomyces sp. NPDC046925 TaxID=3155375 RepID=UPI0033D4D4C7